MEIFDFLQLPSAMIWKILIVNTALLWNQGSPMVTKENILKNLF